MSAVTTTAVQSRTADINIGLWIAVAASCLLFRLDIVQIASDEAWYIRIWYISVLHWLLWQELIQLGDRAPTLSNNVPLLLGLLSFFGIAAFWMAPPFANVFVLVSAAALVLTHRRDETARRIGICFGLVFAAQIVGSSLVAPLHAAWALIDANLLKVALQVYGYHPVIQGSIVTSPETQIGLDVEYVCSTTWVCTLPAFTFAQVTILRHGALNGRDYKALAAMLAAIFVLNVARLVLMSPSQGAYEYWHFGSGADIFSLVTAGIMYVLLRPLNPEETAHVAA